MAPTALANEKLVPTMSSAAMTAYKPLLIAVSLHQITSVWATIRSESATFLSGGSRVFGHLQGGMVILFVSELLHNLPAPAKIELHGNRIRLNDAKSARVVAAGGYLRFSSREQTASDTLPAVLAKYPSVTDPLLIRQHHAQNLRISGCHPCQTPIVIFELQGDRIRGEEIPKRLGRHSLDQGSD